MILKKRDKGTWDGLEKAALMGTNFVSHTFVGLGLGYYFDKWLGTEPWGLIGWLLVGIVAGFRNMYLEAMKLNRSQSLDSKFPSEAAAEKPVAPASSGTDNSKTEPKAAEAAGAKDAANAAGTPAAKGNTDA